MRRSTPVMTALLLLASSIVGVTETPPDIWKALSDDPHWSLTDPSYLYLVFRNKDCPGESMTWLHPENQRQNMAIECLVSGHEQEARGFVYHLSRETPEGYEVTFQPIDPKDWLNSRPSPIDGKEIKIFFLRTERKLFKLTEQLSVTGFYGSPKMRRP